jgi:hypothetical protein
MGVFARIMEGLVAEGSDHKTISIDATYLKAHRTACQSKRGGRGRLIRQPIPFFMTDGQVSDYTGARALVNSLPAADWLTAGIWRALSLT